VNTTLVCQENGKEFEFELTANTIHRPTVAVQMALDQSGSMADDAGTSGTTRLQVLKDAATVFADLIQKNNGIGIIRFDHEAYGPNDPTYGGMEIAKVLDNGFGDGTRVTARGVIQAHGAYGDTSVSDGLEMARNQLNGLPPGSYDNKAILLLTDGLENTPKMIADVQALIQEDVFAVGLGDQNQVNTQALDKLAGSKGGYLLLTGLLSASVDDQFRLRKFFLQILAGVTKNNIVKDPIGYVQPGVVVRVPFQLSEADISCRVITLLDLPLVNLAIETPEGLLIDEANGPAQGVEFDSAYTVKTARFGLPLAGGRDEGHAGTWHAHLFIDDAVFRKYVSRIEDHGEFVSGDPEIVDLATKGAKFCLSVHSFSNLRMVVKVAQTGYVPGSTINLRVALTEYSLPVETRAAVHVQVRHPDGTTSVVPLAETEPGIFTGWTVAAIGGIYDLHVFAEGGTFRGTPFSLEHVATVAVWSGGEGQPDGVVDPSKDRLCRLLACLLSEENLTDEFEERMRKVGLDLDRIRRCIKVYCGR